jgi:hypothetical protein
MALAPPRPRAAEQRREGGQQHEDDDHRHVLHDQPADGHPSFGGIEPVARLEALERHDGARD